jgi:molybdate transport system substrate-binding protein
MTDRGHPSRCHDAHQVLIANLARSVLAVVSLLIVSQPLADRLQLAVASNFAGAIDVLADRFEARTGHRVVVSLGSTGKQYAQIVNGAPFDLFLAADVERPKRLEDSGRAIQGTRMTYAIGELVIWAPGRDGLELPSALQGPAIGRIAIANPRLAPYGRAAREALVALDLWDGVRPRLVRGENIAQAFQFVYSGNAGAGLVAGSQLVAHAPAVPGSRWNVPPGLHRPIEQQGVLLRDTPAGRSFLDFLRSDEGRAVIRKAGYHVP